MGDDSTRAALLPENLEATQLDRIEQKLDELLKFKREAEEAFNEFKDSPMLNAIGTMFGG